MPLTPGPARWCWCGEMLVRQNTVESVLKDLEKLLYEIHQLDAACYYLDDLTPHETIPIRNSKETTNEFH